MKKSFFLFMVIVLFLTSCGESTAGITTGPLVPPVDNDKVTCGSGVPYSMICRIVDGVGTGELLLAELETDGLIPSGRGGVFLLAEEGLEIWLDNQRVEPSELEDGMSVKVFYRESFDGSFPVRLEEVLCVEAWSLGSFQNPGGGYYDLCGLYLQVLDDLWQADAALNADISAVALDLSKAPGGLSETEQKALMWRFAQRHGVEVLANDREALMEGGYLTRLEIPGYEGETAFYQWNDSCLFSISAHETGEVETYSLPVLRFDAHKYRGPLAAYWFSNCTAVWPQLGTWSEYVVGSELIA